MRFLSSGVKRTMVEQTPVTVHDQPDSPCQSTWLEAQVGENPHVDRRGTGCR